MLADLPDNWQHRDIAVALGFVSGFGLAIDACRTLMESWGARLVAVRNKDEIYAW